MLFAFELYYTHKHGDLKEWKPVNKQFVSLLTPVVGFFCSKNFFLNIKKVICFLVNSFEQNSNLKILFIGNCPLLSYVYDRQIKRFVYGALKTLGNYDFSFVDWFPGLFMNRSVSFFFFLCQTS